MTYVRSAWYVIGWSDELIAGAPVAATVLDEPIMLYRTPAGDAVALEDRCVHRLAPLSRGRCEGDNLRCMYHGLLFAPSGQVIEIPGQKLTPQQARVRRYPVEDRHGMIWVWMGDERQADPALIPDAVGPDDDQWLFGRGVVEYEAEARLINDNLLDFSHLSFVHAESFQAGNAFADSTPRITPIERGVRVERWILNDFGPATRRTETPVDGYIGYDYLVPGILIMWSGSFAPGSGDRFGLGRPDFAEAIANVSRTTQAVTPVTAKTARYHFCFGPHRDHGDDALRDVMMAVAHQAFAEDKAMIEAQQRVIDRTADPRIMPTAHDKGVTLFNRIVDKLARAEASAPGVAA